MTSNAPAEPIPPNFAAMKVEADVEEFLEQASSLPPVPCQANTDVILTNVNLAADALSKPEAAAMIGSDLQNVDTRLIAETRRLAWALNFVAHTLSLKRHAPVTLQELQRGRDLRRKLLLTLSCAVEWEVMPGELLEELSRGNAKTDLGHTLINAVALLRQYATPLEKRTFVTAELMAEAERLGQKLLEHGKLGSPLAAKTRIEKSAHVQARDLLFALLLQRYDRMRRIAFWVWGEDANRHVPPLRSAPRRPSSKRSVRPADRTELPEAPPQVRPEGVAPNDDDTPGRPGPDATASPVERRAASR